MINLYNQDSSLNTNFDIYEDLSKQDSDKYEYVPNFNFSKIINEYYSINSNGYYKNYNTNITEKILINNFEFQSLPTFLNFSKKLFVFNLNSDHNFSEYFLETLPVFFHSD